MKSGVFQLDLRFRKAESWRIRWENDKKIGKQKMGNLVSAGSVRFRVEYCAAPCQNSVPYL